MGGNDGLAILLTIGVAALVLVIVVTVLYYLHMRRRREAFQREAARLGLAYEGKSTEQLHKVHRDMPPFKDGRGSSPRSLHVLRGRFEGYEVRFLEFMYTVHTGKSSTTVTHGVALAYLPWDWPDLSVVPESWGHKLLDAFGAEDIDFESDEFSRRFWVRAGDRRFAYDVIHPRMMEYLSAPGWTRWVVRRNVVCLWERRTPKPQHVESALRRLTGFLALVPGRLRTRPPPAQARAA